MSRATLFSDYEAQDARLAQAIVALPPDAQRRIRAARTFACAAHEGQVRKGNVGVPYIIHPVRVAASLIEEFHVRDADALAAALLHDVVEDCGVTMDDIAARFNDATAGYVRWLTWMPGRDAKWTQATAILQAPAVVRAVKAADIIDNARDLTATPSVERRVALRLLYGYDRWGRSIITTLDAGAVRRFDDAMASARATHFGGDTEPPVPPNTGKQIGIQVHHTKRNMHDVNPRSSCVVQRYPIRTHVITVEDDLFEIIQKYAVDVLRPGDILALSERVVAITQGRAYRIDEIRPRYLAHVLVRFVTKNPSGIGLARPETMELALREAGVLRILVAAAVAAVTKPFGIAGLFYRVAGHHVNAIDGPCDYTLPPYNRYAVLGPKDPDDTAERLARHVGVQVAIIDANDLGVVVLGVSNGVDRAFVREVFRDNPLGQSTEQTPMAIVRVMRHA